MSRRERRATDRAMRKAGVAVAVLRVFDHVSMIATEVDTALDDLQAAGADMTSRLAITVGSDHPSHPGRYVVEAKAARAVLHDDECKGCPIDHSLGD